MIVKTFLYLTSFTVHYIDCSAVLQSFSISHHWKQICGNWILRNTLWATLVVAECLSIDLYCSPVGCCALMWLPLLCLFYCYCVLQDDAQTPSKTQHKTFAELLGESPMVRLGDFSNQTVIGKIIARVDNDLYIDYGGKFDAVCKAPRDKDSAAGERRLLIYFRILTCCEIDVCLSRWSSATEILYSNQFV